MTRRYNEENFFIETPNRTLGFYCWTTDTRNGFVHTCYCPDNDTTTKISYINRTWEYYRYETVLLKAFAKLSKEDEAICREWNNNKIKR